MPDMPIAQLLFSFRGRLNRLPYWVTTIAMLLLIVVLGIIALMVGTEGGGLLILAALVYIPLLWISIAIGAKRLHDRDKSAWWLIVFYAIPGILGNFSDQGSAGILLLLISAALSIWALVELGCLRGTVGPNRFGPDPLQAQGSAAEPQPELNRQ